jgi:CRISPR-associated protein Cas2
MKSQLFLACYDIADPRRLQRVHRLFAAEGLPVQYSVFTLEMTPRRLKAFMERLQEEIDPDEDDIRFYPLASNPECYTRGQQFFPEGVLLLEGASDLLLTSLRKATSTITR